MKILVKPALLLILFVVAFHEIGVLNTSADGIIKTVAGNETAGFGGDGVPATETSLNSPIDVFVDSLGNIFIADTDNHRIRKVDGTTGIISTVVGKEESGFSGDGGLAIDAILDTPGDVFVDSSGNMFIADSANRRIRKVDVITGIISTVAGNGESRFVDDGESATAAPIDNPKDVFVDNSGNIFFSSGHRIHKVNGTTGIIITVAGNGAIGFSSDDGPATAATLKQPVGIFVDISGNIFVADTGNHRIRKVDGTTGIISTVAGNGTIGFSGDGVSATAAALNNPRDVFVDITGNIFIADSDNTRIRKVDGTTGIISTVAGNGTIGFSGDDGPATSAALDQPTGVFVDSIGNIFIAGRGNHRIRKVQPTPLFASFTSDKTTGTVPLTINFADKSTGGISEWSWDFGDGNTSVEQNPSHTYNTSGSFTVSLTVTGLEGSDTEAKTEFIIASDQIPVPVATFISDKTTGKVPLTVSYTDQSTGDITSWLWDFGDGNTSTEQNPSHTYNTLGIFTVSLTVTGLGGSDTETKTDFITVNDATTNMISIVAGDGIGGFRGDGGLATDASLSNPTSIAMDSTGNIFIADFGNSRVRTVDVETCTISTVTGNGEGRFAGDGGLATDATISGPRSIFVDSSDNLFIATFDRIRKVDVETGIISTVAGGGTKDSNDDGGLATDSELLRPSGVAVDTSGNIFIADRTNNNIRKVDVETGIISTVAGGGTDISTGDGILATEAVLSQPLAVFVDISGNIFIADRNHNRIRKVDVETGIISTVAGGGSVTVSSSGGGVLATDAELDNPRGVYVDISDNIFIGTNLFVYKVHSALPLAALTSDKTTGTLPLTVSFTDKSTGDITEWSWDFGDGNTSTEQNPSHTYNTLGSFTVSLTVTGFGGSDTKTKTAFITVSDSIPAPVAAFTSDKTTGTVPLTVSFMDQSIGEITEWFWDFGDGNTSTAQNPSHTYNTSGSFTVSLTVTGLGGSDTETKSEFIIVSDQIPAPVAVFTSDKQAGTVPLTVSFTDKSTGDITGWSWEFGDGNTSTEQNPSHTYNTLGIFTVSLTVTGLGGSDTETKLEFITASGPIPAPVAAFRSDKGTGTVPLTVNFADQSIGTIDTWLWDFGDGSTSAEQNPTHTYINEGSFDVSLTVSFDGNSDTEIKERFITALSSPGTVPIANFIADQTLGPPPLEVQFTDLSTGAPTGWLWDFGDGSASIEQNPTHTYRVEGMFTVTLTVTNALGSDSLTSNNLINITPQSGKSFTFNCENSMKRGPFLELEKLTMKLGDSENCTLKLTNHEPGKRVEVSSVLRKGFRSAIMIEPARSITDENGELEITITAIRKGSDWAAWAVPTDRGQFEFNKKTYDTGLAWGMFVQVE